MTAVARAGPRSPHLPGVIDPNQEYLIAVDRIIIPSNYHRQDVGDLDDLAADVKELGVLEPIVTDEHLELLGGLRRLSAAKKKCLARVPVKVRECHGDEALKARIRESLDLYSKPLSKQERDKAGENIRAAVEAEAAKRKAATLAKAGNTKAAKNGPPNFGEPSKTAKNADKHAGETNAVIGQKTGRSRETVRKREVVLQSGEADVIARMQQTGRIDPAFREVVERKKQTEAPPVDDWAERMAGELTGLGRTLVVMRRLLDRKRSKGDEKAEIAYASLGLALNSISHATGVLER